MSGGDWRTTLPLDQQWKGLVTRDSTKISESAAALGYPGVLVDAVGVDGVSASASASACGWQNWIEDWKAEGGSS